MERDSSHGPDTFDLQAYLSRVGFAGTPRPDLTTLRDLHVAHLSAIPFENVDVRLGRPILLDTGHLQEKLIQRRRGGYCFEQNTLFATVLRTIGFRVTTLEARVRPPGAMAPLPRTHMVLAVEADGCRWLADVGFGGDGPLHPVPFESHVPNPVEADHALTIESEGVHVLRIRTVDGWRDLYAFTLTPALPVDFVVANHFTSTWPASPFVNTLTIQRSTPLLRHVLRGRTYTERLGTEERSREVTNDEITELVTKVFGLDLSVEEIHRALGEHGE